jgi:hypothetical protein
VHELNGASECLESINDAAQSFSSSMSVTCIKTNTNHVALAAQHIEQAGEVVELSRNGSFPARSVFDEDLYFWFPAVKHFEPSCNTVGNSAYSGGVTSVNNETTCAYRCSR